VEFLKIIGEAEAVQDPFVLSIAAPHNSTTRRVQQQEIWDQAIWDFCNNICQEPTRAPQQKTSYSITLSAERLPVGLTPTGKRRLVTAHARSGHWLIVSR
jgi:hypothetical protein